MKKRTIECRIKAIEAIPNKSRRRTGFLSGTSYELDDRMSLKDDFPALLELKEFPGGFKHIYSRAKALGCSRGGGLFSPIPEIEFMFFSYHFGAYNVTNARVTYHLKAEYAWDFWYLLFGYDQDEKELGRDRDA
jgi:hypothetical protein